MKPSEWLCISVFVVIAAFALMPKKTAAIQIILTHGRIKSVKKREHTTTIEGNERKISKRPDCKRKHHDKRRLRHGSRFVRIPLNHIRHSK